MPEGDRYWTFTMFSLVCIALMVFVMVLVINSPSMRTQVSVEEIVPIPTLVRLEGQIDLLNLTQMYQRKLLKKQSEQIEILSKAQQAIIRGLE